MPRPANPQDQSTIHGQVGAAIRRRRLRKKLSVDQVATSAGVPPKTWYNWESGRGLALERLPAIAQALDCTPKDLVPATMPERHQPVGE